MRTAPAGARTEMAATLSFRNGFARSFFCWTDNFARISIVSDFRYSMRVFVIFSPRSLLPAFVGHLGREGTYPTSLVQRPLHVLV